MCMAQPVGALTCDLAYTVHGLIVLLANQVTYPAAYGVVGMWDDIVNGRPMSPLM